jgi:UDP-2,4-diacetamido-2,4,6-trideoxy-beta-L-altropyranose hydrolase
MKLVIRADSSSTIGGGHLLRCLAIADSWKHSNLGEVIFICGESLSEVRKRIIHAGYRLIKIPVTIGSQKDAEETYNIAAHESASAIIMDGYSFDTSYQTVLRDSRWVSVVYDDDGSRRVFDCDVVINQNVHAKKSYYRELSSGIQVLAGGRYAAIRGEFFANRTRRLALRRCRILVSLGLSDTTNQLEQIIKAIGKLNRPYLKVDVLLGRSDRRRLIAVAAKYKVRRISFLSYSSKFSELAFRSHLGLVAAGGTASELASLGLPMLLCCVAANQRPAYWEFIRLGAALGAHKLGSGSIINLDKRVMSSLTRMLDNPALCGQIERRAKRLVDGFGASRIVTELEKSYQFKINRSGGLH